MPELPEVETILRGLQKQLGNTPICDLTSLYKGTVVYDPQLQSSAFPARVKHFERRGKYIILHLDNGNAMVIHLRMTGKLIYARGEYSAAKHIRASMELENGCTLIFNDIRTFGKIILCLEQNIGNYLPELGPEPLSESFDTDYLKGVLGRKTAPVKTVLLDQAVVAGLGNIYVCEILYRAKVNPLTPSKDVSIPRLKQIVKHTRDVIIEAIAHNGTSVSDYRQVDDKTGSFQNFLKVYQKEICPLGHPIKRIKQAGRSSFYCPVCQK